MSKEYKYWQNPDNSLVWEEDVFNIVDGVNTLICQSISGIKSGSEVSIDQAAYDAAVAAEQAAYNADVASRKATQTTGMEAAVTALMTAGLSEADARTAVYGC